MGKRKNYNSLRDEPLQVGDWSKRGACNGIDDPDIFFKQDRFDIIPDADADTEIEADITPEPDVAGERIRRAKAMCARCAVQEVCLNYAIEHEEKFGIWGGLDQDKLKKIRKERARVKKREEIRKKDRDTETVRQHHTLGGKATRQVVGL